MSAVKGKQGEQGFTRSTSRGQGAVAGPSGSLNWQLTCAGPAAAGLAAAPTAASSVVSSTRAGASPLGGARSAANRVYPPKIFTCAVCTAALEYHLAHLMLMRRTCKRHWRWCSWHRVSIPSSHLCTHQGAASDIMTLKTGSHGLLRHSATWSMVWLAPQRCSSPGRSAVSSSSGTAACAASTTAGSRLATAVPLLVTTTAGRLARGNPCVCLDA